MNKTAKPISNTSSKWTQQDAANKSYPRLKRRHKKAKAAPVVVAPPPVVAYDVASKYPHAMKDPRR